MVVLGAGSFRFGAASEREQTQKVPEAQMTRKSGFCTFEVRARALLRVRS